MPSSGPDARQDSAPKIVFRTKQIASQVAARGSSALCAALALWLIGAFFWAAARRIQHPFELEWMEGGIVEHVARVLDGRPLYVRPSVEFVPYIYNPLYYVLAAPFMKAFGSDFFAVRLLSVLATLASFVAIFELVRRETRRIFPALLSMGLFAGTYPLSGAWFDVARVDSLCLCLCLVALLCARWGTGSKGALSAAGVAWLAFAAKQSALAIVPAIFAYFVVFASLHRAFLYLATTLGLVLSSVLIANILTEGWYWYYAFLLPAAHPLVNMAALPIFFWHHEIFSPLPVTLFFGLYYMLIPYGEYPAAPRAFLALAAGALLLMAFAARVHTGSFLNDTMPAHAALALLFGMGFHTLTASGTGRLRVFGLLLALCQLIFLVYNPKMWFPTKRDRAEGQRLMDYLASHPGDVLLPHHSHLPRRLGKRTYANEMAVVDVLRAPSNFRGAKNILHESYEAALRRHQFSAVVLDDTVRMQAALEQNYALANPTFLKDPGALICRTGARLKPRSLYLPKR